MSLCLHMYIFMFIYIYLYVLYIYITRKGSDKEAVPQDWLVGSIKL